MNEIDPHEKYKKYVSVLCINEYNKDIPFSSYYYKLMLIFI